LQKAISRIFLSNQDRARLDTRLSQRELFLLVAVSLAVTWITALLLHRSFRLAVEYGDNTAYLEVANAIRHWEFQHVYIQHFMGYPYFIAAVSLLLHIPTAVALWLVAVVSSFVSVWLVAELFGTIPAAHFALTVTVRPLMICILIGIGLVLLYRKQFLDFFIAVGTGMAIGTIYVVPLYRYFADPLQNIHSYTTHDYGCGGITGPRGRLFGWPFHGIIAGTIAYPAPWTNLLMSFFWIGLVLLGTGMMFTATFRKYARTYPNEANFLRFVPAGDFFLRLSALGSEQLYSFLDSDPALRFLCRASALAQGTTLSMAALLWRCCTCHTLRRRRPKCRRTQLAAALAFHNLIAPVRYPW
jgi:hypothetical protein